MDDTGGFAGIGSKIMSDEKNEKPDNPILKIASTGATTSGVIAFFAFLWVHPATDLGMFAVAIAIAAPSAMAFGICHAMIKYGYGKPPQSIAPPLKGGEA